VPTLIYSPSSEGVAQSDGVAELVRYLPGFAGTPSKEGEFLRWIPASARMTEKDVIPVKTGIHVFDFL